MADQQNIKEIIKQEYALCINDSSHFLKKYCMIQHPTRGRVPFNLYPFQEKVLFQLHKNKNTVILKSRQLGITTLVAGLSLWLMLFHKDKNILCIATKQDTAKNMVTKVRFMYENLPSWLKGSKKPLENNKLLLKLENGSQIKAVSAAGDAGRSEAASLLLIDEAAFIDSIDEIFASAQQTLATGGGCIALSTPNGTGNWFHKTWQKAEISENSFVPIKLPWYVHPERDQKWRDSQDLDLGSRMASQECFSGNVIIYTLTGPKFIKDIEIGDKILSHDGTYNPVLKTINSISENIIKIKGGINNINKYTTENHPFLNENNEWETIESIHNSSNMIELFPSNISHYDFPNKVIDLKEYIIADNPKYFPIKSNNESLWLTKTNIINRNIEFDYNLGFLVGCFLSEGSLAKNKIEFSFNGKTERNGFPLKIEEILSNKFNINNFCYYTSKRWEGSSKLYIKDQIFHNFIKLCIQGGNLCHQKSLSEFFYENANTETLRGIVDGVLIGDGMLKNEYNISLLLTSEKLIYDILYINNLLGIHNITIKQGKSINPSNSNKWRPNYTLTWLNTKIDSPSKIFSERIQDLEKNTSSKCNFKYNIKPYVSLKLEKHNQSMEVFNLEVENTHTYVTEYGIAHNCDCDFNTSGNTVFESDIIQWFEANLIDPIEKRGVDGNLWIWEQPNYSRSYLVVADVARGDGKDSSGCHVFDIESASQVAEYKGQIGTREYGHMLVGLASEYNDALLSIENNNIGWDTVQTVIDRGYRNMYYSPKADTFTSDQWSRRADDNLVPGFTTSTKTRPLMIEKFREYSRDKSCIIRSKRLIGEMKVFIWKNGKAQAQDGYNDDLVMSFSMGLYLRDTALRFRKSNVEYDKAVLDGISMDRGSAALYFNQGNNSTNQWQIPTEHGNEDIMWLL